ncbi:hypothetical protein B0H15DRAFT_942063 [Mycena belliarum]|uniref:Uncharacterized protein n=1 Tax=Mycena belliarum TaxID=1033014 RepID=A0AAD6UI50_9AGAR|nr:hypothetical protein B0H15DRAFT_942063 [Mycena belliae]
MSLLTAPFRMNNPVFNAVHAFLSSARFELHLPSLSDGAWDTTFSSTQHVLNTRRSGALLVLSSTLAHALLRISRYQYSPGALAPTLKDLETLREAIFSDDVLALFLVKAGVYDPYCGQGNKQAGDAFLVFVDMIFTDRGITDFMTWFANTFDPILSVGLGAQISGLTMHLCGHDLVDHPSFSQRVATGKTSPKRTSLSDDGEASKRRRTGLCTFESIRPDSITTKADAITLNANHNFDPC